MMIYLLIDAGEQEEQMLLDDIAEFFWNNGNRVYSRSNFEDKIDYLGLVKCCDCMVFLSYKDCSAESFFEREHEVFLQEHEVMKSLDKKSMLVFTINGVYSNAIPSPHKIFHFERLSQNELTRFFHWCEKLKLFATVSR